MSHVTVLVIGEDVHEQLAPFQENNNGTCPEEYLEFYDVEKDYRENYETGVLDGWLAEKRRMSIATPIREVFSTFDDYMEEVYGVRDPKTGRYGDWWNPDARWDWYVVGGRWTGFFVLKPGRVGVLGWQGLRTPPAEPGTADQARIGDIDFDAMAARKLIQYERSWEACLAAEAKDNRTQGPGEESVYRRRYGIPKGARSKEEFMAYARKRARHCSTFAVLKDGEWVEQETDDFRGMVGDEREDQWDERYSALLKSLPDETLLTLIDCHL